MGSGSRASATGTSALLANPAGLSMAQQFAVDPMYQFAINDRTHGIGIGLSDSLNNQRVALGIYYIFSRGTPRVGYTDLNGAGQSLDVQLFGHEVGGVLSVAAVINWLSIAVKPKYLYTSLRFVDDEGDARNARPRHSAFGLDGAVTANFAGWARLSVVGENLLGPDDPNWTEDNALDIEGIPADPDAEIDPTNVDRVSSYARMLHIGAAIMPLHQPDFSINGDVGFDFTSYFTGDNKRVRIVAGGGGEYVLGPVPIRVGGYWDSRGADPEDDRGYVTGGSGFIITPKVGGVGVDIGVSFSQQVAGPKQPMLETVLTANVGIRIHPDL